MVERQLPKLHERLLSPWSKTDLVNPRLSRARESLRRSPPLPFPLHGPELLTGYLAATGGPQTVLRPMAQ